MEERGITVSVLLGGATSHPLARVAMYVVGDGYGINITLPPVEARDLAVLLVKAADECAEHAPVPKGRT